MNAHMNARNYHCLFVICAALVFSLVVPASVYAALIQEDDIFDVEKGLVGSGNGSLNLRMMTFSGAEIPNTDGLFNGDNGNNTLPKSNIDGDTNLFDESYVTTAKKLKDFYDLNFGVGVIDEIVLFLDLNETRDGEPTNTLAILDVILNPVSIDGGLVPLPTNASDITSAQQAGIDQEYTGGTLIANLNPQPAANLPVVSEGAGFADYAIFTGIDPYALNDDDVLLFNISMEDLSDGSEEIFLSGEFAGADIPEPATVTLLVLGGIGVLLKRKRK